MSLSFLAKNENNNNNNKPTKRVPAEAEAYCADPFKILVYNRKNVIREQTSYREKQTGLQQQRRKRK